MATSKIRRLLRLGEVLVEALIFFVIMVSLHEYAHVQVIQLLGGEGFVKFTVLSGVTTVTRIPAFPHWHILTAVTGGGTVAAIYYALDGLILEDDTSIALRLVTGHQLPYAVLEGLGLNRHPLTLAAVAIGVLMGAAWSIPLFKKILA